jgi:outer membrane lipoprotein-sorting protein
VAFADVVRQVAQTHSFTARVVQYSASGQKSLSAMLYMKGPRVRLEFLGSPDQLVNIGNRDTGELIALNTAGRSATRYLNASDPFDLPAWLRDVPNSSVERVGEKVFDGRRLTGFASAFGRAGGTVTVWVDPVTKLPVRVVFGSDGTGGTAHQEFEDVRFDVPLDDALFDTTPPKGFYVQDMGGLREDQIRPIVTTQEANRLVLHPGQGIADVRFGTTRQQIVQSLGEPEFAADDHRAGFKRLEYPSRGMTLYLGLEGSLRRIEVYDAARRGVNGHAFPGKTESGIGIGSTAQAFHAAHGPPDRDGREQTDLHAFEIYHRLGLHVSIDQGRITSMTLTAPGGMGIALPLSDEARRRAEAMVLHPGLGMDDLKLGATRDQAIAVLGKPDEPAYDLQYPQLGLSLNFDPKGNLFEIWATRRDHEDGDGNPFAGKTDRGIHIGSTREDVETAYGKPDVIEQPTTARQAQIDPALMHIYLNYRAAGVEFGLRGGEVEAICIRAGSIAPH